MNLPTPNDPSGRPRLILAHADSWYVARTSAALRQLGWDTWTAATALEARRLARKVRPAVVVLSVDLPDESGWLTCSKLVRQHRGLKVYLIAAQPSRASRRFAEFVGAAGLLDEAEVADEPACAAG